MRIDVWAPAAQKLEIVVGGQATPLRPQAHGGWSAELPGLAPGVDYAFGIDGGRPRPDPRSPWQPAGVHGPSRAVDHDRFDWHDADWQAPPLEAGVIYELHVGTFTPQGNFDAVTGRLDHLLELGVTHIELMPVNEFPGTRGWGYDGVDLYAPHHAYGGPEALKRLVDACHTRGLAVLLDVVYNHLGPDGNYLSEFGPYFTNRYVTPWGPAVNLDGPGSDEVRRYLCDNAVMWLRDYHFDGLRIDAVHAFVDSSAVHFLEELALAVEALQVQMGRHLLLIAESDLNDPRIIRPAQLGGYGLDAQWSDDFHHALHVALTGETTGYYRDFTGLADMGAALQKPYVFDGRYSTHRRRRHGRPVDDWSGAQFVVCMQNHDQVGNRARGERISHLASLPRVKAGAAILLSSPFVPMLFQGEEWGASSPFQYFTDHQNPRLARDVSEGRRREFADFGWKSDEVPDPQAEATFLRSKLNWDERAEPPHDELLDWYRTLIRLRRSMPVLQTGRAGEVRTHHDAQAGWLVFERGPIAVACNLGCEASPVPVDAAGRGQVLAASDRSVRIEGDHVFLPPDSVVLIMRPEGPA